MNLKIATDLEASFSLCKLFSKLLITCFLVKKWITESIRCTHPLFTNKVCQPDLVCRRGLVFFLTWHCHNCFNFEPTDNSDNGLFLFASRSLLNGHTKMTQGKSFWKSPGSWGNVFPLWLNFYKVENVVKVQLKLLQEIYENGALLTNFISHWWNWNRNWKKV